MDGWVRLSPVRGRAGLAAGVAAALVLGASAASGQDAGAGGTGEAPTQVTLGQQVVNAGVRLGRRVLAERSRWRAVNAVVVVSDARSYREAIALWTRDVKFPVLIDDGSPQSREDIARFARAFAPGAVVRWQAPAAEGAEKRAEPVGRAGFASADLVELRRIVARVWGLRDEEARRPEALAQAFAAAGHVPPGVVMMSATDEAWSGGLALAAARGQALIFTDFRQDLDRHAGPDEIRNWTRAIEAGLAETPWSWRGLGDDIDAITIAANAPFKWSMDGREMFAASDRVGRLGLEAHTRFAWAGYVPGSAAQSAYRAMSAIFLQPREAWIFDGYAPGQPWESFDGSASGDFLRQRAGLEVEVLDTPGNGVNDWRLRAARPVKAGVILGMTKGNSDFFELTPGRGVVDDVPVLGVPSAVHIVHSWSLERPGDRRTLGGRWLERGAYAYVGSVHEPMLSAFVPTPVLVRRLAAGLPWGAAVMRDEAPAWKVGVIGDPLMTLARLPEGAAAELPIQGAAKVDAGLPEAVRGGRFAEAMEMLVLSGRDADASRLVLALLKDKPEAVTSEVARAGLLATFRAGATNEVVELYRRLDERGRREDRLMEAARLAAYAVFGGNETRVAQFLANP
jgi:hypothetical protein